MPLYSHSRISTFESCPLKYKFSYIDKLEAELGNSIEAFMGSMVHMVLERLYTDLKFLKIPKKEELIKLYNKEWKKNYDDSIVIVRKNYDAENYRKMGEKYISDYYDHYHPFDRAKTIGCEMRITVELKPGYTLQGYIDRLSFKEDGVYEIHDYKTSGHLPSQEDIENDRQLALYSLAVRKMFPDVERVILIWHYLAFDKELRTEKSEGDLEALKKEIISRIYEIENSHEFKPKESPLCNWCQYQPICPRRKHLFKNEEASPEEFAQEDGVELANTYFKLSQKKKEIETQMDEVKDRIYKYADRNNVDTLYGSSVKIRVWKGESVKITDNEEKREELINVLKDINLYNELLKLDTYKLSKMFRTGQISQINQSLIKPYISKEPIYRLYPSRFDWPGD
jgi:putative RecB family exonuclease